MHTGEDSLFVSRGDQLQCLRDVPGIRHDEAVAAIEPLPAPCWRRACTSYQRPGFKKHSLN